MVDSKAKGARGELLIRDKLRELTGLPWERTPGSGALGAQHQLKGDLYVPNKENIYCVEVKNYEEDQLTSKILTNKSAIFPTWWDQAVRQANQTSKQPLLIFKYSRSKIFTAFVLPYENPDRYDHLQVTLNNFTYRVTLIEEWIKHEQPKFIK